MTEKTKTVLIIESHQQTIVRRSRGTSTATLETFPPEIIVPEENKSPRRWWKTVARKGARVLGPLTRLKRNSAGQSRTKK